MATTDNNWPAPPATWPENLNEVETCQFLRIDAGRTIAGAKRTLRYLRREKGLPSAGRIGRTVLFRRTTIETWMAGREALQTPPPSGVTK